VLVKERLGCECVGHLVKVCMREKSEVRGYSPWSLLRSDPFLGGMKTDPRVPETDLPNEFHYPGRLS
jgi:hypothetical protein